MARPCKEFGCPQLVMHRNELGYCDDHASQRVTSNWQKRSDETGSTTKRGYGAKWQKLRKSILARDKGLCQECKRNGLVKRGNQCDHINPKAAGGTDDPNNLQTLCLECHKAKTGREAH